MVTTDSLLYPAFQQPMLTNFQTFVDYSLSYDATMDWSLEHHANGTTEAPRLDWIMQDQMT